MARVFFPGCKVKARYPQASARLLEYLQERGIVDEVVGCCRTCHQNLKPDDIAVCICVNCMAMIDEDAANRSTVNAWELIDADEDFAFPSHAGMTVSVQDCGRSYDRASLHDAVRSILRKMNVTVVEMSEARGDSVYCGWSAFAPVPAQDASFAPHRYGVDAQRRGMFVETPKDQAREMLLEHVGSIPADEVVCYCTACHTGLEESGKRAVNLVELVFGS